MYRVVDLGCTEVVATFAKKSELVERVKVLRKEAKSVSPPLLEALNTLDHCHMRSAFPHSDGWLSQSLVVVVVVSAAPGPGDEGGVEAHEEGSAPRWLHQRRQRPQHQGISDCF
jgi:hypothetical protein